MVREITAWQAADGTTHADRLEALQHDAIEALKTTQLFNHATAMAMAKDAIRIVSILEPVAGEAELRAVEADQHRSVEHLTIEPTEESR